jgi:cyclase
MKTIVALCASVALAVGLGENAASQSASARQIPAQSVGPKPGSTALETLPVQGGVHVIVGSGANVVVQVGPLGSVVVDSGSQDRGVEMRDAIRALSRAPIRFIINTHAHPDHVGANELLAASGAGIGNRAVTTVGAGQLGRPEIVAHELVLIRMSSAGEGAPVALRPTATFSSEEKVLFVNGEGIQIVHQPTAHSDGDSLVFFRRSDVIATGDLFSMETYPIIDVDHGGRITGVLAGLNHILKLAISGEKVEGGTMIVPGHGRISDEADLVEYRDMVTIVRERIDDLIRRGMTLAEVQAARPTLDYDGLYGRAPTWTAEQFVEAVYRTSRPTSP